MKQRQIKIKEPEQLCKKCGAGIHLEIRGRKKEYCKDCFKKRKIIYDRDYQRRKYEEKKAFKLFLQMNKKGELPKEIEEVFLNLKLRDSVQQELKRTTLWDSNISADGKYNYTADIFKQEEIKRKEEVETAKIRKIVQEELRRFFQELSNKNLK